MRIMNQKIVDSVMLHSSKGHQVLLGHHHGGKSKIKIKFGPFGLLTTRYDTDFETFEEIKNRLRNQQTLKQA